MANNDSNQHSSNEEVDRRKITMEIYRTINDLDNKIQPKDVQKQCIEEIVVNRKNLFATLPTGSGKSLIFVGAVLGEKIEKKCSWTLLIVPILALMKDHITTLRKFKIDVFNLQELIDDGEEEQLNTMSNGPRVLISLPETLFNEKGKELFEEIANDIKYIVIDEVHLLQFWGDLEGKNKATFRETFTRLRELFVYCKHQPILINLTATLTSKVVNKVMYHLGISKSNTFMIHISPINKNTHITIMDNGKDFNLLGALKNVVQELTDEHNPKRVIIFCRTLQDCGIIYRDISHSSFKAILTPLTRVVTAESSKESKEKIFADMQDPNGKIKIIIATSVISMGVNIRGARYVIQLGMPTSFEEFIQKIGRCGRENEMGFSILNPYWKSAHLKTDKDFKEFCLSKTKDCLHKYISLYFPGVVYEGQCISCSNCSPVSLSNHFIRTLLYHVPEELTSPKVVLEQYREVSTECTREFKEELQLLARRHLHKEFGYTPIIGRPTLTFQDITAVCDRLYGIKSEEDLADLGFDREIRQEILCLVYDFFRDISEEYSGDKYLTRKEAQRNSCIDVYEFIVDDATENEDDVADITDYVDANCALDP